MRSRRPMSRTDGCALRISYAKEATGTSVDVSFVCIRSAIRRTSCSRSADIYAGRADAYLLLSSVSLAEATAFAFAFAGATGFVTSLADRLWEEATEERPRPWARPRPWERDRPRVAFGVALLLTAFLPGLEGGRPRADLARGFPAFCLAAAAAEMRETEPPRRQLIRRSMIR
ncbi:hypothetical protein, conserved [Leishmania tarentolae]|uniref:Uncharacterized protein n=1 Tax=Leishmania tarentolae TaxID=5689 RepID=A0A640KHW0_LEITA|nr:hypothetical protein, conserved [Leishmania tarentolae]